MGHLVLIANHDKKEVIHPIAKIRELEYNDFWWYVLCDLLHTGYNKGRWAGDRIEIVSEATLNNDGPDGFSDGTSSYEIAASYKDVTEEMKQTYEFDYNEHNKKN